MQAPGKHLRRGVLDPRIESVKEARGLRSPWRMGILLPIRAAIPNRRAIGVSLRERARTVETIVRQRRRILHNTIPVLSGEPQRISRCRGLNYASRRGNNCRMYLVFYHDCAYLQHRCACVRRLLRDLNPTCSTVANCLKIVCIVSSAVARQPLACHSVRVYVRR